MMPPLLFDIRNPLQSLTTKKVNELLLNQAYQTTLAAFLQEYTLHDSNWSGIWWLYDGEAVAIVDVDVVWFREWAKSPQHRIPGNHQPIYLMIWFSRLYTVIAHASEDSLRSIAGVTSVQLTDDERLHWLSILTADKSLHPNLMEFTVSEKLTKTLVIGHVDLDILILHDEDVRLACFDSDGEWIDLPGLVR